MHLLCPSDLCCAQATDRPDAPASEEPSNPQFVAAQRLQRQAGTSNMSSDRTTRAHAAASQAEPPHLVREVAAQISPGATRCLKEAPRTLADAHGARQQTVSAQVGRAELPVIQEDPKSATQCQKPWLRLRGDAGIAQTPSAAQLSRHGLASVVSSVMCTAASPPEVGAASAEATAVATRDREHTASDHTIVGASAPDEAAGQPIAPAATGASAVDLSTRVLPVAAPSAPKDTSQSLKADDADAAHEAAVACPHQPPEVCVVTSQQHATEFCTAGPCTSKTAQAACLLDPAVSVDAALEEPVLQAAQAPAAVEVQVSEPETLLQMKKDLLTAHLVLEESWKERLVRHTCPQSAAGVQALNAAPGLLSCGDASVKLHAAAAPVPSLCAEAALQHAPFPPEQENVAVQSTGAAVTAQTALNPTVAAGQCIAAGDAPQVQACRVHDDSAVQTGSAGEPFGQGAVHAEQAVQASLQPSTVVPPDENVVTHTVSSGAENAHLAPSIALLSGEPPGHAYMHDPEAAERSRGSVADASHPTSDTIAVLRTDDLQQHQADRLTDQAAVACSTTIFEPSCQKQEVPCTRADDSKAEHAVSERGQGPAQVVTLLQEPPVHILLNVLCP